MEYNFNYKDKIFYNKFDLINYFTDNNITVTPNEITLSFQKKIDEFKFTRNKNINFYELSIKRLKDLRQNYDYLRLWYSGGKDSAYILHLAEYCNIEFDEIFVFNADLFQGGEVNHLKFPERYRRKNKINIAKINENDYELVWRDKNWYRQAYNFSSRSTIWNQNIYKYINPVKKILQCPNNFLDILGGTTPIIWFDKNWNFVYNEYELDLHLYSNVENFIVTNQLPELLEAYVNNIINELENKEIIMDWPSTLTYIRKSNNNQRFFRNMLTCFNDIHTNKQLAKKAPMPKSLSANEWSKYNASEKEMLTLKYFEKKNPKCYKLYKNTNWNLIKKVVDFGTIMSKKYKIINKH